MSSGESASIFKELKLRLEKLTHNFRFHQALTKAIREAKEKGSGGLLERSAQDIKSFLIL